jgi:hypothetical protein
MSEAARKRRGPITFFCENRRVRWIVLAAMLPALYLGGFGAAIWLGSRSLLPGPIEDALAWLYYPLILLVEDQDRSGPACPALSWYWELFEPP